RTALGSDDRRPAAGRGRLPAVPGLDGGSRDGDRPARLAADAGVGWEGCGPRRGRGLRGGSAGGRSGRPAGSPRGGRAGAGEGSGAVRGGPAGDDPAAGGGLGGGRRGPPFGQVRARPLLGLGGDQLRGSLGGRYALYARRLGKILEEGDLMVPGFTIVAAENPLEHVIQHPLVTRPADLGLLTPNHQITLLSDQILMMIVAGLLLVVFVPLLARKRRGTDAVGAQVPAGFANFLEATCEYLRNEVAEPALHEHTDRFVKYIWTLFFFVLINNLLGLIPVSTVSPLAGIHLGGTATGNIWVTGTLAAIT